MSNEYYDTLIKNVRGTGLWRRKQALRFPDDPRNLQAAELLAKLATTPFADVDQTAWTELQPYLKSGYFLEACNEVTRSIGFRAHPKNIDAIISAVSDYARGFGLPSLTGGAK